MPQRERGEAQEIHLVGLPLSRNSTCLCSAVGKNTYDKVDLTIGL